MNAKEFRIGNYLQDREGRLCRVEELSIREGEREVYAPAIVGGLTSMPNKPIVLNAEWLLKFGAKQLNEERFTYSGFKLIWNDRYKFWNVIDRTKNTYFSKVEFVHEWQNLVYVMEGEELEIRPK